MVSIANERSIHIDGIGEVLLKKSPDAHYLRLRVDPKKGIILTLPVNLSEQFAFRFLYEKKEWIRRSLQRQLKAKNQYTVFTEDRGFKTRMHTLYLARHCKNTIKSVVSGDKILIWFPDHVSAEHPKIQKVIRKAVEEAWRVEAKKYLPIRVRELATRFNFRYNHLSVKNAKTRWGSCSAENNINLNLQLMRLPDRLIDYVILHELMHTIHKNHQKPFWNTMESVLPGAKKIDKELNKYNLQIW
jgi:predicted metal-dependent hydrolase